VEQVNQHEIYPFIHVFSNILNSQDVLAPIAVPDVLPSNLPPNVDFSMVAGEFLEVYNNPKQYGTCVNGMTMYHDDSVLVTLTLDYNRHLGLYCDLLLH
jgi:carnosine N-methyltransferase